MPVNLSNITLCIVMFAVLEACWLYSMSPYYKKRFTAFSNSPLSLYSYGAAALSYLLLFVGFWYLVLKNDQLRFLDGAIFGLVVYGVYNMTNKATMRGYSWQLALIDTAWGAIIFGLVAALYKVLGRSRFHF